MVTKDVSRSLLQVRKHYVGARVQQGRVLLDSDFNENVDLGREDQRRVLVDVIGPAGSSDHGFSARRPLDTPADETDRLGIGVVVPTVEFTDAATGEMRVVHPLAFRPGSLYAGGLRFDLDDVEGLLSQRDYLQLRPKDLPEFTPGSSASFFYYLRGWEQSVSALEDPELREAMLRNGDTSARVRRMRRVEVFKTPEEVVNCDQAWVALRDELETDDNGTFDETSFELRSNIRLRLEYTGGEAEDTCAPADPFGLRYLGAENQTLRVLLAGAQHFVWTLDNPRLVRVRVFGLDQDPVNDPEDVVVELLDRPTEERDWPFVNRVVEIIPFGALLDAPDLPGPADPHYRKIAAEVGVFTRALETYDPASGRFRVDQGNTTEKLILADLKALVHEWPGHPFADQLNFTDAEGGRHFYMRVWHQAPTTDDILLATTTPAVLGTTGIQTTFTAAGKAGDHWIVAFRPEAPAEAIPFELLATGNGAPPTGPKRYFSPLAFVTFSAQTVAFAEDCRPRIRPLNNRLCTTLIVGDGIHSFGDFTSIQSAIRALPKSGGTISVRPGIYRETIEMYQRTDITIEGCGPSTILQTPEGRTNGTVVSLILCDRIQLRSFAIRTLDGGISLFDVRNTTLADLDIQAGDFGGSDDAFRVGRGQSSIALLSMFLPLECGLRDVVLQPKRQTAINHAGGRNLLIERLRVLGSNDNRVEERNGPPLLALAGGDGLSMRDATIRAFSQIAFKLTPDPSSGLTQGCRHFEFYNLDVESDVSGDPFLYDDILLPFDIDDPVGTNISVRSSRIKMGPRKSKSPCISILANDVTIENNLVTVEPDAEIGPVAWGGIHVRGGSTAIRIEKNTILNGAGHGITLGSVRSPDGNLPPGFGQQLGDGDGAQVATGSVTGDSLADEGVLSDVLIADNRIEGFHTNGISALTVLGIQTDRLLLEVSRLRIERNRIRDNARRPWRPPDLDRGTIPLPTSRDISAFYLSVPRIPLGGVVLANGRNIEIIDNQISGNGKTTQAADVPVSGIFVLAGDVISIEGNRIENNGSFATATDPGQVAEGVRAGIAVMLAGTNSAQNSGQGISDFLLTKPASELDNRGVALRVVNNTVRQPEGRALHAVAVGPVSIDGNFFASQGNHNGPTPAEQYSVGDVIYVQNLGAPWETFNFSKVLDRPAASGQPQNSKEYSLELTPHLSPIMLNKVLASPRWYMGLGGQILFVNNQVVYDFTVKRPPTQGAPLGNFACVLLGLDQTTVVGNQFALRLENVPEGLPHPHPVRDWQAPLYANLLAAGVSTNIELNRFSETLGSVFLSLLANGDVLNITALNQSTHRIHSFVTRQNFLLGQDPFLMRKVEDNLVLIRPNAEEPENNLMALVKPNLQDFLKLTFRPF